MQVNKVLNMYVAVERTPGIEGGVIASGPTPAEAILRCMIRKAAAYQGKVVFFDSRNPVRALRASCACLSETCESMTRLMLPAAKTA